MDIPGSLLEGEIVKAQSEYSVRHKSQRLADLKSKTVELERELDDVRTLLKSELDQPAQEPFYYGEASAPHSRTETLINLGRYNSYRTGLSRGQKAAIGGVLLAGLIIGLVIMLSGGGAAWPTSVATVQSEISKACQNPDVVSEPDQVNFACDPATRQVLWVFALMTSGNDPNFNDATSGRLGLEPITPAQGGQIAWSLNLHHPYNPFNPSDSLQVAARAINSIIGGATVTGAGGTSVVQPGLESNSANCLRYTGSGALTSHAGFPPLCAQPLSGLAGQGALVADVYQRWIVGAPPGAAQDAAVLFENFNNPGDPQVQAILKQLPAAKHGA
jgi:hypothetical protein